VRVGRSFRVAEADVEATSLVEFDEDHFVATANGGAS